MTRADKLKRAASAKADRYFEEQCARLGPIDQAQGDAYARLVNSVAPSLSKAEARDVTETVTMTILMSEEEIAAMEATRKLDISELRRQLRQGDRIAHDVLMAHCRNWRWAYKLS